MATTDLPKPDHSRNMRLVGYSDQGGRCDGVQIMVHRGYAYIGHIFSKGFTVVDVRDPGKPEAGQIRRRRRRTPGRCTCRPSTTCCSSSTTRTCSRSPSSPTRRTTTRARSTSTPRPESDRAQLVGRAGRLRHLQARRSEADRLHAGRGHRPAPPLVCRRTLGLRLGAARRLLRLHPHHHRHAGPEEAEDRRKILAAGHECRRRREGELADQERPLRPASRDHPRRHRLLLAGATPASSSSTSRTRPIRS